MNQSNLIIEEEQLETKDYMQATSKSTQLRIQIMKFLETMSMWDELNLIKLLNLLTDLIYFLYLLSQHVLQFMGMTLSKQDSFYLSLEAQTTD